MALSQEILQLESWLRREKVSPEILMYQEALLNKIIERIESKQEQLISSATETLEIQFDNQIYQLDLDRMKYLVANYLRTRLLKIQNMAISIVYNGQADMLSSKEYEFLTKFYLLKTNHFKKSFLLNIPEEFRKIEDEQHSKTPITRVNLKKHVIVKAVQDLGTFKVDEDSDLTVNLMKNDIIVLPYSSVRDNMMTGRADFI
jgi:hypothetical protein